MKYAVADIRPNPFRHIDRYPIRADKVTALRESLRSTGFWGNVVARTVNGKAEIAYGHHRLAALKAEYGGREEVDLIIRKLSDEQMLQIMARENMEEWGTSAAVEQETVRAVVEAFAEGKIELGQAPPGGVIREAPSFVPLSDKTRRASGVKLYSVGMVAEFLGWLKPSGSPQEKVGDALNALQFIEEGVLRERDFDGLSTTEAGAVVAEARRARAAEERLAAEAERRAKQAEAQAKAAEKARADAERREREARTRREQERAAEQRRRAEQERREAEQRRKRQEAEAQKQRERGRVRATSAGTAVGGALRRGEVGHRQARQVAQKAAPRRDAGPPPHIDNFVERLAADLNRILDPERDSRTHKLEEVTKFREHIDPHRRAGLVRTLRKVADRAERAAEKLESQGRLPAAQRELSA